jgi:hypothetical protein
MDRFPSTISLIRLAGTLNPFAKRYCERSSGFRNSSNNTSPGCTGGIRGGLDFLPLMVINDFDFIRIAISPLKTDAPLVVYPNAVLASAIARKLLQTTTRGRTKIVQTRRGIKHYELPVGRALQH